MKQASSPLQNKIGFGGGGLEYRAAPSPWVPLGTRKLELARQQEGTALTPDGRCLPARGRGHSAAKTFFVRAPWEIIPDKLIVYRFDFLLRRGARCRSHPLGVLLAIRARKFRQRKAR